MYHRYENVCIIYKRAVYDIHKDRPEEFKQIYDRYEYEYTKKPVLIIS